MKNTLKARNLLVTTTLIAASFLTACASTQKSNTQGSAASELLKCTAATETQKPKLLWSTPGFSAPESVVYDKGTGLFYVSNVVGQANEKDGKGWISKVSKNGKLIKAQWADGHRAISKDLASRLNAPKGLDIRNGILWVSDIDEVVGFQLKTAKKSNSVKISGAKFLNDIVISKDVSAVYVSDMADNKIYSIQKSPNYTTFLEGPSVESPNGLTLDKDQMLIAAWGPDMKPDFSTRAPGHILSVDLKTKAITPWVSKPLGHLDGIEFDGADAVIVSDWMAGKVYHVKKSGECVTLLEGFKGSADLTFVPESRTLVIPLMGEDKLLAYKVPKL